MYNQTSLSEGTRPTVTWTLARRVSGSESCAVLQNSLPYNCASWTVKLWLDHHADKFGIFLKNQGWNFVGCKKHPASASSPQTYTTLSPNPDIPVKMIPHRTVDLLCPQGYPTQH